LSRAGRYSLAGNLQCFGGGRGDGESVESLAAALERRGALHALCVDFDRTLASTKTGGSPLVGAHTLDTELLSALCAAHDKGVRAAVVTRNAHIADIGAFLARHGVPSAVPVLHTRKGVRKSSVMREHGLLPARSRAAPEELAGARAPTLAEPLIRRSHPGAADDDRAAAVADEASARGTTIFVDDTLAELAGDPELSAGAGVLRVLFIRGSKSAQIV